MDWLSGAYEGVKEFAKANKLITGVAIGFFVVGFAAGAVIF